MSEQNKIDEIKARHAAATPGPWKFRVSHREYGLYGGDDRILSFGGRVGFDEFRGQEPGMDDEVFIQYSWEDVQHLLAEIERKDKALRFYENTKNYEQEKCLFDGNENDVYYEAPEIMLDLGQRAREAL